MQKILKPALLLLLIFFSCSENKGLIPVKINEKRYNFELAATSEKRREGLMYRQSLPENSGMLFVFPSEQVLNFYMKNTLIPLDIAFINSQRVILNIEKMTPLDLTTISSHGKAIMAIETNRGFFEKNGIKAGDKIELMRPIPYIVE